MDTSPPRDIASCSCLPSPSGPPALGSPRTTANSAKKCPSFAKTMICCMCLEMAPSEKKSVLQLSLFRQEVDFASSSHPKCKGHRLHIPQPERPYPTHPPTPPPHPKLTPCPPFPPNISEPPPHTPMPPPRSELPLQPRSHSLQAPWPERPEPYTTDFPKNDKVNFVNVSEVPDVRPTCLHTATHLKNVVVLERSVVCFGKVDGSKCAELHVTVCLAACRTRHKTNSKRFQPMPTN